MLQLLRRVGPWLLIGSSADLIVRQDGWARFFGFLLLVAAVLLVVTLRLRDRQRGTGAG